MALADPFTALVRSVQDWDAPTPCQGWNARDLVDHVVQSQRDFAARAGREIPVFDGSRTGGVPALWAKHAAAVESLAGDASFIGATMKTALGEQHVGDSLLTFYGFDLIVHRWDLARSQGRDERFSASEMELVEHALDSFGAQAYTPGILEGPLEPAPDADRQGLLLARLGRRA